MRLLGLDPGLRHTGWGVIEAEATRLSFIACGAVDSDAADDLATRLGAIYAGLNAIVAAYRPAEAAVEETVVNRNPLSSLKLGHARGVVLLVASHARLPVSEYASRQVKRAVTGTGAASKDQIAMMVRMLLGGRIEARADAADALAVAICHAHHRLTGARIACATRASLGGGA
ncbi:MAG TPA: crossover junction endodeoxyribonuclease RuvC [Geminicoccaceae bacterium]|nr:crossover junction endodeoxyribonuclease RuvC [Geminicoccaceae bacterium]